MHQVTGTSNYAGVSSYLFTNLEITNELANHNYYVILQSSKIVGNTNLSETNTKGAFDLVSDLGPGAYNVRVFVKHFEVSSGNVNNNQINNNNFTDAEKNTINDYLRDNKITPYKVFEKKSFAVTQQLSVAKAIYVVVEKVYSLNVIGGNNMSFDTLNQAGLDMKIALNSSNNLSQYILSGLSLDLSSNKMIDYVIDGVTVKIPNYYFSFLINGGKDNVSNIILGKEAPTSNGNEIKYKYYDVINGYNVIEEKYKNANELFELYDESMLSNASDMFIDNMSLKEYLALNTSSDIALHLSKLNLVKPKLTGVYNIFIETSHTSIDNSNVNTLKIWGARFHDISVTILDEDDGIDISEVLNGLITIEDISKYSYKCDFAYYRNSDIRYNEDKDMTYHRGSGISGGITNCTLLDIIGYYSDNGKVLYDLSTGRIITEKNLGSNPFILTKSIILGVKNIS